jgi:phage terminase large subunit-like protein
MAFLCRPGDDMVDKFLAEVRAMHELRAKARAATPEARAAMLEAGFGNDWIFTARDTQLPPPDDDWWAWLLMGGRGGGKTQARSACAASRSNSLSSCRSGPWRQPWRPTKRCAALRSLSP